MEFVRMTTQVILLLMTYSCVAQQLTKFDDNYLITFGANHITRYNQGEMVELLIDPSSGAGFKSKFHYMCGLFQMRMKIPSKSDGIITTFYLITPNKSIHDELDIEFLGDNTIQTNVYVDGVGGREQRVRFWFDPSADFHTYRILWNPFLISFFVDGIPIRTFKNNLQNGINLRRSMHIEATLWNASWAGEVDWTNGPFKAQYEGFGIDGCLSSSGPDECGSQNSGWCQVHELSPKQLEVYKQIKKYFLHYDYCTDPNRKAIIPNEC